MLSVVSARGAGHHHGCTAYSPAVARATEGTGGTPPTLSAAEILRVAVSIADRDGLTGLSMRRLAGELSVTPMALYWHFPGKKHQLLDAIAEQVFADAEFTDAPDAPWEDRYRHVLTALVGVLRRHPWMGRLVIERIVPMPHYLVALEIMLDSARAAGLDPRLGTLVAQQAVQSVVVLAEYEPQRHRTSAEAAAERNEMAAFLGTLDPDLFPHLRAAAEPLTTPDEPDDYYRVGLDMIVGGIRAIAASE